MHFPVAASILARVLSALISQVIDLVSKKSLICSKNTLVRVAQIEKFNRNKGKHHL